MDHRTCNNYPTLAVVYIKKKKKKNCSDYVPIKPELQKQGTEWVLLFRGVVCKLTPLKIKPGPFYK